jgi:photosystem II stability/assembly factor-like uncharacterized protein
LKIRSHLFVFLIILALLLPSCNLPEPAATPGQPTPRITTITAPVPPEPTASASGPAIAHIPDGQGISIMNIHMLDLQNGWGIGGLHQASDHVFRTQDGGATWQDVTPPQPEPAAGDQAQAIGYFLDFTTAWVIYGSVMSTPSPAYLWITHDGGGTWQYSLIDTSFTSEFFAPQFIDFVNPTRGWMLVDLGVGMSHSYVALLSTIDGGLTWTTLVTPQDSVDIQACPKTSMVFQDVLNGWMARDCRGLYPLPYILHTSDGGSTWTSIQPLAPASLPNLFTEYACDMASPVPFSVTNIVMLMKCLNMADFTSELDYFYSTNDGGLTWSSTPMPVNYSLGAGLVFLDPMNGFALGRNIYKTTDGGQTWSFVQAVTWEGQFSFITADKGWASVINDNNENALVFTVNGGVKWDLLNPMVVP